MKKIIMAALLCLTVISLTIVVNVIESNKKSPKERNREREVKSEEDSGEKETEKTRKVVLSESRSLEYELLSYEIIEDTDIEKQDTYKAEYFYAGEVPEADYQKEAVDKERARKECPELAEIWDDEDGLLTEEQLETYHKYIGKYKYTYHPKTRYLFVKCKITNLREKEMEEHLALYPVSTPKDGTDSEYAGEDCYFDKPQHTEGEDRLHGFYLYRFGAGESIECTLGFEIEETFGEDEQYYLGTVANYGPVNPETEKNIIKVTEIGG